jgi:hypothetical protein
VKGFGTVGDKQGEVAVKISNAFTNEKIAIVFQRGDHAGKGAPSVIGGNGFF